MENETDVQGGSAAGQEATGQGWPFDIDPSALAGQEPADAEEPQTTDTEGAQPAEVTELPDEARQIWALLQNDDTKDQALRLIHAVTGYDPPKAQEQVQESRPVDFGQKPDDWAEGDWHYLQMIAPFLQRMMDGHLGTLGLSKETVGSLVSFKAESDQSKAAAQAEQKALGMYGIVKAELKKADKAFPDFSMDDYKDAVRAYQGYKYRDAVKLYMTDRARQAPRGATGRPEISDAGDRRADAPPQGIAEAISRGIRSKMLG